MYKNLNYLEICCSICFFKNIHKGHKIIEISDIESLSKENITIESITNDFTEISQNVIDLTKKIENEINNINELYEKTINSIAKSYLKKHEILLKEENEVREKLENKVNKTKEKLEFFFLNQKII